MGFQQGLSGLNVSSKNLDVIGNNVANASTVGFKSGQAEFADVFAASLSGAGSSPIGLGAKVAGVVQQFTQGNITTTNNPLDLAINGGGFFIVSPPGTTTEYYTRNGQFSLDNQDYVVNNEGLRLQAYPLDPVTGQPGPIGSLQLSKAGIGPLATGMSPAATGVQAKINLDSRSAALPVLPAFDPNNPSTYNSSTAVSIYDSLGNAHTMNMYFRKDAADAATPNLWRMYASIPDVATGSQVVVASNVPVNFTNAGVLSSVNGVAGQTFASVGPIAAPPLSGGVAPMNFKLNLAGSTQYGSNFAVTSLAQDGHAPGELSGFNVSADGIIKARYSNGQSLNLGQVALANFANPQGLQPLGNNRWAVTSASGQALRNPPGAAGNGVLQSAAVEDSNVDLTAELVNMITAQRVYQANAQTIKTQDAVMQTLVNLR